MADDNPAIRRVECHVLKEAGFVAVEARNGQHVIEILEREKIDVILLDIMMPLMDGFTVCKTIKENARWSAIPVIMVSAKDNKDDIIRARMVGADDYILKPFKNDVISERIKRALKARVMRTPRGLKTPEKRKAPRVALPGAVKWTSGAADYGGKLLNLSVGGLAFEFTRCTVCTGYQKDTVHPMCLMAPVAKALPSTRAVAFTIDLGPDRSFKAEGKVVHVYQAAEGPAEVIGVAFSTLDEEARKKVELLAR